MLDLLNAIAFVTTSYFSEVKEVKNLLTYQTSNEINKSIIEPNNKKLKEEKKKKKKKKKKRKKKIKNPKKKK